MRLFVRSLASVQVNYLDETYYSHVWENCSPPGFLDSGFPRFRDSSIPGFPNSRIARFPESPIPGIPDSPIHRFPLPLLKIAIEPLPPILIYFRRPCIYALQSEFPHKHVIKLSPLAKRSHMINYLQASLYKEINIPHTVTQQYRFCCLGRIIYIVKVSYYRSSRM